SPGNSMHAKVTAKNDTAELVHVQVSSKDWFVLDANKAKKLTVKTWLKPEGPATFDLKAGESREGSVLLTWPKEAEGEPVGMVSFLYVTDHPTMITPVTSVSMYVEVAGTEKVAGEVRHIAFQNVNNQMQAAVIMKATGNVHIRPLGSLTVLDAQNDEVVVLS